jgi:hypothetical protein
VMRLRLSENKITMSEQSIRIAGAAASRPRYPQPAYARRSCSEVAKQKRTAITLVYSFLMPRPVGISAFWV